MNHPLPIAAILVCLLVGGYCCPKCNAQGVDKADQTPQEDPGARKAADALAQQLGAANAEVRENAATALEAMGKKAGKALTNYISDNLSKLNGETQRENVVRMQGITKAATVLGKIGKGIAEDTQVREALWAAAEPKVKPGEKSEQWANLQMRLAAIEALGKINEYRGGILGKESSYPSSADEYADSSGSIDLHEVIKASEKVTEIAGDVFKELANGGRPAATPPPTPTPTTTPRPTPLPPPVKTDGDFYDCFLVLHNSQAKLVKLATQVKAAASGSNKKTTETAVSKLTDAKTLAASLRKIEVGYLDATKTGFAESPGLQADDKSHWQLKTEAAYDLLSETKQLNEELHSLDKAVSDRLELSALISDLGTISQKAHEKSESEHKLAAAKLAPVETSNPDLITAEAAKALNRIFSKRPPEKPPADATKKETAKDDAAKKDTAKKDTAAEE